MAKKEPEKPDLNEVASIALGRDITRGYVDGLQLLDPQDRILLSKGNSYQLYEDILRDDQVQATFTQRRMAVVSREWTVEPGGSSAIDKAAADHLRAQLLGIQWDRTMEKMLYGIFYGFGAAELLYGIDGSRVVINDIKVRKQRRFGFAPDGDLRLKTTRHPMGEPLPPRKFWTYSTGADNDDDPYGIGLAHWLYWPVFFKRHGVKYWLVALEKWSQPTPVGKHPANATPDEKTKLLKTLRALMVDAGVILPEGMQVELLEAKRSGTADYSAFNEVMNAAISKIVVGQTMTTDDGSSRSQSEVHMKVQTALVKSDADLVCDSFNRGPAVWLTAWNFPGAKPPKVWRKFDDPRALEQRAKTEEIVARFGYRPTLRHVQETYGGEWEPAPVPSSPPASFAEGSSRTDTPTQVADQLADRAAPTLDAWIDRVKAIVDSAKDFDEVKDRLLEIYGELDPEQLGAVMERAFLVADLAGRAEVIDGA